MLSIGGYYKCSRGRAKPLIRDNPIAFSVYNVLLYYASYRDGYRVNGRVWDRGDVGKSLAQLADGSGRTKSQVRAALSYLISEGFIAIKDSGNWGTIYSISEFARQTHARCTPDARQMHSEMHTGEDDNGNNNKCLQQADSDSCTAVCTPNARQTHAKRTPVSNISRSKNKEIIDDDDDDARARFEQMRKYAIEWLGLVSNYAGTWNARDSDTLRVYVEQGLTPGQLEQAIIAIMTALHGSSIKFRRFGYLTNEINAAMEGGHDTA